MKEEYVSPNEDIPQQHIKQFENETIYCKKRMSEISQELDENFSLNRLQKLGLNRELNQQRTRLNSMLK